MTTAINRRSFKTALFLMGLLLLGSADFSWAGAKGKPDEEKPSRVKQAVQDEKDEEKAEEKDRYLALVGGDLHTVTGPVMPATDVLVKNGIIERIGPNLELPSECEALDVSGMQVYPGLIAVRSSGILGKEPPEHSTDLYGLDMVLGLAGGLTTVLSDNTAAKLTLGSTEGMILKRKVFTTLRYSRSAPKARQDLRKDLLRVKDYLRDLEKHEIEIESGKTDAKAPDDKWLKGKYEEYLKLLKSESTALISASASQDILDACDLAVEFGFNLVIERGVESWIVPGEISRANAQVILTPRRKREPNRRKARLTGWNIETADILYKHGVRFAIVPDRRGISLGGITGRDLLALPMEASFAVRGGLPEKAALESITIDAARMLGLERRIGSIETGKDGDFIVCDGDLLHYNTLVQWTIVNGLVVYDKEKESLFAHIRPRDGAGDEVIEFWPRPFKEMPDYKRAE